MSNDDPINAGQDGELTVAEYVLGTLSAEDRRAAERRMAREHAFANEVAFWEQRLGGLAAGIAPVAPPIDGWARIEAALAKAARPVTQGGLWQSVAFWRSFAFGASALATRSRVDLAVAGAIQPSIGKMVAFSSGFEFTCST